ncbi:MAG: hypothetical protein ACTS6G_06465 [Candidatus Hodgkinia cicadicola]
MLINLLLLSRLIVEHLTNWQTLPVTQSYLQVALKLLLNNISFDICDSALSSQSWALILSDINAAYVRDPSFLMFQSVCRKQGSKALA